MIYTIYDNGRRCGQTPIMRQALTVARRRALATGRPCVVEAERLADGERRRVRYNPDGSMVKLWKV